MHPGRLDRHLRLLRRLGLRGASLAELVRATDRGEADGLVGLTFDDGYTDFPGHAVPVLERHGMTGTVYVVAGRLAGHNEWDEGPRLDLMDTDAVRAVAAAGHEVGSHTLHHAHLRGASPAQLAEEIAGSRAVLQDVLQADVPGFAYPWGEFDAPRPTRCVRPATTTPASPATTGPATASRSRGATSPRRRHRSAARQAGPSRRAHARRPRGGRRNRGLTSGPGPLPHSAVAVRPRPQE